ncbi:hypothetical protein [Pseudomonas phage D6]|nr:hypothetical protein [Pseudomonas phage D6]
MIKIETTKQDVATALGLPQTYADEVIRRLFLTSDLVQLPDGLRVNVAESEAEWSGQIMCSPKFLTVQKRGWGDTVLTDVASLLQYIKTSAKALLDSSVWDKYTGPKAPEATGVDPEPKWVPHYPPQGKYAVYPPSGPAE